MRIIEKYITGKSGRMEDCEDFLFFNDDFASVIDGATSTTGILYDNKTPGQKISELILDVLKTLSPKSTLFQTIETLNEYIQSYYKKKGVFDIVKSNRGKGMSASIALYSKYYNQVWLIGDCNALTNNMSLSNRREIDEIIANTRALILTAELVREKNIKDLQKKDIGREFIIPLLKQQYVFQNNMHHPLSFSVVDGFSIDMSKVKQIDIDSKYLILATDGYPKLFSTLEESEKYLYELLLKDSLLISEYKSTKGLLANHKSYDDRAYLKIEI